MRNIIKKGALMTGLALTVLGTQAQFKLSGEYRPRAEYRHGYKSLGTPDMEGAFFVDQRSRLNLDFQSEGFITKMVLQDVRVWGNQSQLVGNEAAAASIHEAWGEALISEEASLKFGRQELVYDDHRIFGSVGWAQQARSHDALLFKYKTEKLKLHVGAAFNQDKGQLNTTMYTVPKNYKTIQFLWAHYDVNENLGVSLLGLNNGKQVASYDLLGNVKFHDTKFSQTAGTRVSYKKEKMTGNFNGYYQMGNDGSSYKGRDLQAMLFGADFGYKVTDELTATVGYEYQSGQSQTDTNSSYTKVNHSFSPFYGTNHKFNGFMDYFYVGNHMNSVGLQDVFVKLKYKAEKYWVGADWHMFSATADVLDLPESIKSGEIKTMNPYLGMEVDLTAGFNISKGVAFKMGYSQMLGSETLATLKGVVYDDPAEANFGKGRNDQISNWAWAMIIVKPEFFKTEKK